MKLAAFIQAQSDQILADWSACARTALPVAAHLPEPTLRNDVPTMLVSMAREMDEPRVTHGGAGPAWRQERDGTPLGLGAASHAMQRALCGYEADEMLAEYAALRTSVLRLWCGSPGNAGPLDFEDVVRFNAVIDRAMAQSLRTFMAELDHARELLLGVVGHDLRSPLGAIQASAQLILLGSPERGREIGVIMRSVARMKGMVEDLADHTRVRLGVGIGVVPERLSLYVLASRVCDEMTRMYPGRAIEVVAKGATDGTWDEAHLHRVLGNLLVNAIKYGDRAGCVTVSLDGTDPSMVSLAVHNFGPPIAPVMLPVLFDPMTRGTAAHNAGEGAVVGLGLGLFVVRELVAAHGGTVGVTSTAQDGTSFVVRLPRHARPPVRPPGDRTA